MNDPLTIYLHDHLTGSNFAVELLDGWRTTYRDEPLGRLAADLHREIEEDRVTLRGIIDRIGGETHPFKETVGWIAEKAAGFKLRREENLALGVFEGLEMLALGILGKRSLWAALDLLASTDRRLQGLDFPRLAERATGHHARVEAQRLGMIIAVFGSAR
ncbi:hypothetical protein [Horticoccus sp. 23ND18S-11]|uniref:hypothetical protein n=1 Tax=Horticoccus sp. 23ND18S-11 TaxID=3391832 RepID=UPI0039C9C7D1